jgi:hypothetical protein
VRDRPNINTFLCVIYLFLYGDGVKPIPPLVWPLIGLLYQPWGAVSGTNAWQGKAKYSEGTFPSAVLSATDPALLDLGSNPQPRIEKPL